LSTNFADVVTHYITRILRFLTQLLQGKSKSKGREKKGQGKRKGMQKKKGGGKSSKKMACQEEGKGEGPQKKWDAWTQRQRKRRDAKQKMGMQKKRGRTLKNQGALQLDATLLF
jgi:hypothetical protein